MLKSVCDYVYQENKVQTIDILCVEQIPSKFGVHITNDRAALRDVDKQAVLNYAALLPSDSSRLESNRVGFCSVLEQLPWNQP